MVETLTDNRNRTAANMRHYFDKFGGNLGQMGCVGFMFTQKGVIVVDLEDKDPDELMMDALDAGADDFDAGEDAAEVTTSPRTSPPSATRWKKKGYKFISADVAQVPSTTTVLTDPDQLVRWASCWTPWTTMMMSERLAPRNEETWIAKPQECQSEGRLCLFYLRQNGRGRGMPGRPRSVEMTRDFWAAAKFRAGHVRPLQACF